MKYEIPNAEIVLFDDADIIATSEPKDDPSGADKFGSNASGAYAIDIL